MKRLGVVLLILAGCRTRPADSLSSRDRLAMTPARGGVAVKLIPDPQSPNVQLGPDEELVQPQLNRSNAMPVYPPQLVTLHLPPHTVVLRVMFDEDGRVLSIAKSPIRASTEDDHAAEFEAAVGQALASWKCYPPRIRKFRPGPDTDNDGKPDYRIMVAQRALKTFFDLSFSFEVVNGQPVVKGN